MQQYNVTGMSCAACSARVEKAVSAVPGVTSCAVSLLTNSMGVEGTADAAAIISAVENAGYGASPKGEKKTGLSRCGRRSAPGSGDTRPQASADRLNRLLAAADVCLHGARHVGLASAGFLYG